MDGMTAFMAVASVAMMVFLIIALLKGGDER